jgi:hypothetical protein
LSDSKPASSQPSGRPAVSASAQAASPGLLDPYREWLDIKAVERPPSHYALLGLPELESDPEAIAEASRNIKKTVRAYQIGKYRPQALALLTEIGQAVDVLTNPEKKAAYDLLRLRRAVELAEANFPHAEMGRPLDEMFADWLDQCDKAGLPLPQLLPQLMEWCLGRAYTWPSRGLHEAPLPLGLWLYFEAAVIGQCVERSPLERRIRAVKIIQQAFGVSERLSRIINLDIARRPQSFASSALVTMAANEPRELMQQWVDRLGSRGLVLEPASHTFSALAFLLGLVEEDGKPVAKPIRPRTVQPRKPGAALAALRSVEDLYDQAVAAVQELLLVHRSALKLAALLALGLVLAVLGLLMLVKA